MLYTYILLDYFICKYREILETFKILKCLLNPYINNKQSNIKLKNLLEMLVEQNLIKIKNKTIIKK